MLNCAKPNHWRQRFFSKMRFRLIFINYCCFDVPLRILKCHFGILSVGFCTLLVLALAHKCFIVQSITVAANCNRSTAFKVLFSFLIPNGLFLKNKKSWNESGETSQSLHYCLMIVIKSPRGNHYNIQETPHCDLRELTLLQSVDKNFFISIDQK